MTRKETYSFAQRCSCILMILSLVWLTVSLPFITSFRDSLNLKQVSSTPFQDQTENQTDENALAGSAEEKNSNASAASEEYLHGHALTLHQLTSLLTHKQGENENFAITFNAELISPPPEC